tara:strand:- start:377 stop:1087 length:711 start_codon:yes stop_codon:yes gene_type:complete
MPKVIADNESEMQRQFSKQLLDNESLSKKISKYLKNLFALENPKGDVLMNGSLPLEGGLPLTKKHIGPRPKPPRPRPPIPGEEFGPDPLLVGIKNIEGKKKAKNARPNAMPRFESRSDKGSTAVEYDYDSHICYLYDNCELFDEYTKLAHSKTRSMQFNTVRDFTLKAIQDILGTRIAITRARDFMSEDDKRVLLGNEKALLMVIMSPFEIVDKVLDYTKHLDKKSKEMSEVQTAE